MPNTMVNELAAELQQYKDQTNTRLSKIEAEMVTLNAVHADTAAMREILETWRAGRFAVLGLGKFVIWLLSVTATIAMLVQIIRGKLF